MHVPIISVVAAAALVMLTSGGAQGAVLLLNSDRDNTLFDDLQGATSNGAGDTMFAGVTAMSSLRRALLRFDVAGALPAGAVVTSAAITLTSDRVAGSSGAFMTLHRVTQSWGEGASIALGGGGAGGPAEPGDATWTQRFYNPAGATSLWSTPGGDFLEVPSAIANVGDVGAYTWASSAAMVNDVQAMLDAPATNFGWILIGDETSTPPTAKRFFTREAADPDVRPTLRIEYVPAPATGLVGVLVVVLRARRSRR